MTAAELREHLELYPDATVVCIQTDEEIGYAIKVSHDCFDPLEGVVVVIEMGNG